MPKTTRQTAIFGVEDWKRLYQTYREADFQSYDFETLRKSFIDYLRLYYPETFNDYIESSEYIALLDVIAFMGQALAFRNDLNARENFLDTAERRDSVVRLANLVGYTPKRNTPAEGFVKVFSVSTTENVVDFNGVNLANITINWNDSANVNWREQFITIINAALTDSQKFGRPGNRQNILGVLTDEYSINLVPGFLPVIPYSATVDGVNMPFEVVSSTSLGEDYVYEPPPRPSGVFNILFRNDSRGFASANTGFFFLFKQGVLQDQNFNLAEAIPNRTVNINVEGCNENDHWLYKLDDLGSIASEWKFVDNIFAGAVEQLNPDQRELYSVTSRANDQITLVFGDGVFSTIPVGTFRAYVRASNGLNYIINPEEMQNVIVPISYISRAGRLETLTLTCGITVPVSNAQARETIPEIKQRAPARYYTQNRMVNGEDYNNFPFTLYNSIIKSKAVARSATGMSRYVYLTDITGKYSSTNVFASDGVFYRENIEPSFEFEWLTRNDIVEAITNLIEPQLSSRSMQQFYYANYPRPSLTVLSAGWFESTTTVNETTGYFYQGTASRPLPLGSYTNNNAKYVTPGALVKFIPPTGYFFDPNNRLKAGIPTRADEKTTIWATVSAVVLEGTAQGQGNLPDGVGPVTLNNFVPTGALAELVIPRFIDDLPATIEQQMIQQIELYRNFGIGFDNTTASWYIITSTNLAENAAFSLSNAQNTQGLNLDASWLVQFITDGQVYTVTTRGLDYKFASVLQTRFFFDGAGAVYDSKTGSIINDFVRVLKSNSRPDSNVPLPSDITCDIIGQPVQSDGFVNDYEVVVSYSDFDVDNVADDPDFFDVIVAPTVNPSTKLVFFQRVTDFDDLERYLPLDPGVINTSFTTINEIEQYKNEFISGQVFYATSTGLFYVLEVKVVNGTLVRTLIPSSDYLARTGRGNLAFQYRHNSDLTNVIDPGSSNIIDLYVVTQNYYTAYQNYIKDSTGTVPEPPVPTIAELQQAYSNLDNYKMVSDNVVLNSVRFKPLFGNKAPTELRGIIKVVRANTVASDSEIKSQVVSKINEYFQIDKWDFGDSFYFSELAAYLHRELGSIISSVVLVPLNPLRTFGDLYEIRSAPNEIFVNAATVADIEVITALTQSNLRTETPVTGFITSTTTGTSV